MVVRLVGVEMDGLEVDLWPYQVVTVSKGLDGNGTGLMFILTI